MTHRDFCMWLDGFLTNRDAFSAEMAETIRTKLASVAETPAPLPIDWAKWPPTYGTTTDRIMISG